MPFLTGRWDDSYSQSADNVLMMIQYHLFDAIRSEIDDLRAVKVERSYVRVAFAGGKQPPSDLTDADGICEWLDERGIIDREWHRMKTIIDSAHRLESLKGEKGQ